MPGIEFVGGDTGEEPDEDVLDVGPRRPVPRWVWWVAAVAVLAVVGGVAVASRSGRSTPSDARSVVPSASSSSPAIGSSSPSVATGSPVVALAADGTSLYWVAGGHLYRGGPVGRPTLDVALGAVPDVTTTQIVPDPDARLVWVVRSGTSGAPGRVDAFSTTDLTSPTFGSLISPVGGAAVFNGALWVISGGRLLRLTGEEGPTVMTSVDRTAHGLVAAADRLLFVEGGNGSAIGSWSPSGLGTPTVLRTTDNTLGVAGSTVFVLGTTPDQQAELDTLDLVRHRVDQQAVGTGLEGPQQQLVATGPHSVILKGIDQRGDELACITTTDPVDAPGPASVQALATATSTVVTVLGTTVFQADGDTVRPADFTVGRCST